VPRTETALGLAVVLVLALLAGRSLLTPGFYDAHDNLINVHRLYEMDRCFADRQLPCRWAPDMSFGFGLPLFNFYPPLPTYLGEGLLGLGLSHIDAVKLSMLLSLLTAAGGMFALSRELYGTWGGLIAAALYTWAPYRALDIYVRGALGEAWGLALLPFVFWTVCRISRVASGAQRWAIAAALAWCALLMSHLLVTLMVAPLYAAWCLLLFRGRTPGSDRSRFAAFFLAHFAAAALSAHFLLPSWMERETIHLESLVSLFPWNQYSNNFISIQQALLGSRPWGYGAFGAPDGMSVFVGALHWIAATGAVALLVWRRPGKGHDARSRASFHAALLFAVAGWLAVMLALPGSRFFWQLIPPLAFLQFPWRFIGIAAFGFSLAAASLPLATGHERRAGPWLAAASVAAVVGLGWSHFEPAQMHPISNDKLANPGQIARMRHGAFDYLPRSVNVAHLSALRRPGDRSPARALAEGSMVLSDMARGSDWVELAAELRPTNDLVAGSAGAIVRLNTYRFPGWRVQIDGLPVEIEDTEDPLGRIHVRVPPGSHRVTATFDDTPVRRLGNGVTLLAAALLPVWIWRAWRPRARSL